jgi:hypothetical protein
MAKKIGFIILILLTRFMLQAQGPGKVEMADTMHANGKIFVVVAVILTIFTGIIIYLVRLDRKISKLEKNNF